MRADRLITTQVRLTLADVVRAVQLAHPDTVDIAALPSSGAGVTLSTLGDGIMLEHKRPPNVVSPRD